MSDPFAIAMSVADLKQSSFRGSLITVFSQSMKILVQMISQIVLSRLLFPSDFGLLAMAAPAIGFIQVFSDIGLGQAIIQRQKLMQDQVSALFWFNIVISILLFCLVVILSPLASALYNEPRVESLMIVLGALIPFSALGIHPVALLSRQLRFWYYGKK